MKERLSFKKLKRFFSFGWIVRNDKLMVIVSLILAATIWFNVISGPANIIERSIEMDITVDLTGSYAYQSGLRIVGENSFTVKVNVSGPWATLVKLDEDDLRVRADLAAITRDGINDVPLTVSRNSTVTDYDILSVTPSTVHITCEYWKQGDFFDVEIDTAGIMLEDPEKQRVGTPVLDKTDFPSGKVTIDGPEKVVDEIDRVVAKLETKQALKKEQQFEVPLIAYDKTGRELDISSCVIREIPDGMVTVTVPVWECRTLEVQCAINNLPSNVKDSKAFIDRYIRMEPVTIVSCGLEKTLDSAQKKLDLGTLDFNDLIASESMKKEYVVRVPNENGVEEDKIITISFDKDAVRTATLTVTPSEETVRFVDGGGKDVTQLIRDKYLIEVPYTQNSLNLSLIGNAESIANIKDSDFVWNVTVGSEIDPSVMVYEASIAVDGYDDVWIVGEDQLGEFELNLIFSTMRNIPVS